MNKLISYRLDVIGYAEKWDQHGKSVLCLSVALHLKRESTPNTDRSDTNLDAFIPGQRFQSLYTHANNHSSLVRSYFGVLHGLVLGSYTNEYVFKSRVYTKKATEHLFVRKRSYFSVYHRPCLT